MTPFLFQIQSIDEARCSDPHHHHFTHLSGQLQEGIIRVGQRIRVTGTSGVPLFASIGSIIVRPYPFQSVIKIAADQGDVPLTVAIRTPAIPKQALQIGLASEYQHSHAHADEIAQILLRQPEVFLHSNGYGRLCSECSQGLPRNSATIKILLHLTTHPDADMAQRALWQVKKIAKWTMQKQENKHSFSPAPRWWEFWHR